MGRGLCIFIYTLVPSIIILATALLAVASTEQMFVMKIVSLDGAYRNYRINDKKTNITKKVWHLNWTRKNQSFFSIFVHVSSLNEPNCCKFIGIFYSFFKTLKSFFSITSVRLRGLVNLINIQDKKEGRIFLHLTWWSKVDVNCLLTTVIH